MIDLERFADRISLNRLQPGWENVTLFCERYSGRILSSIVVVAMFIRILYWYQNPVLSRDSIFYLRLLDSFRGENNPGSFPPMLLWIWSMMKNNGFAPEYYGRILNITAGTLLVPLAFYICRQLNLKRIFCMLAAAMIAVYPTLVEASCALLRESLMLFFLALSILLLLLKHHVIVRLIFAGFCAGTAFLCRYEAGEFLLWLMAGSFLLKFYQPAKVTDILFNMIIGGVAFFITIVCWELCMNLPLNYFLQGILWRL